MNFIVIDTQREGKVVINLDNVISFRVTHPRPAFTLTEIKTTNNDVEYYAVGDITKELTKLITNKGGSIVNLN